MCTIHYPNSLSHGIPHMIHGKVLEENSPGMLRLIKRDAALIGCKGQIVFKKNILSTQWSYRKTNTKSIGAKVGAGFDNSITLGPSAGGKATKEEATAKIAVELNISVSEVKEQYTVHQIEISDEVCYTELHVDVDYGGVNQGRAHFQRNDLGLTMEKIRWDPKDDTHMILTINL